MTVYNNPNYYINRELSWLSFNERVLEEALDPTNPLLERFRYLAITSSNLDEFFMVRVAGLKEQVKLGYNKPDRKSGLTPTEQLEAIFFRTHLLVNSQYHGLYNSLFPALTNEGIYLLKPEELTEEQQQYLSDYFIEKIYPVLTPMAIDYSHPFPMLFNRSLNLAVLLADNEDEGKILFALVEVPAVLPRIIRIPSEDKELFVLLEDVITKYIEALFQGKKIISVSPFRITKNADLDFDEEDEAEDLLKLIQKELKRRNLGSVVRLEIDFSVDNRVLKLLKESLEVADHDIYSLKGPLDLTLFNKLYNNLNYNHLKFEDLPPLFPEDIIGERDIFDAIAEKDILLHHPFESFEPVIDFIRQAAEDPNVLAIKQTLYRISGDSPIIKALAAAAENGKQVTVLVELKARFDEENNITWAKKLEEAGCHVIYGLVGLKTHSKITLIVRMENGIVRRYVHLSTGNYNDITARYYTDMGMFTARKDFGDDATDFFNHLSGYSETPSWKQISIAPNGLKSKILNLIDNEINKHSDKNPGRIIFKMNSLTSKDIIDALYKAAKAGVKVELIIRGICCLRPGINGVSENIKVISIVGRFLEHSRIYYFNNGGDERVYLSSADLMTRNLDHRIEILFPVLQKNLKQRLINILEIYLKDNVKARMLTSDGTYQKEEEINNFFLESHSHLYQEVLNNVKIKELRLFSKHLKPKTRI